MCCVLWVGGVGALEGRGGEGVLCVLWGGIGALLNLYPQERERDDPLQRSLALLFVLLWSAA